MPKYLGPLLVLDLETTSDDPYVRGASILEIGAILTRSPEMEVIAEASILVRPPGSSNDHDVLYANMIPVVRDMHASSGLWAECTGPDSQYRIDDADRALVGWLDSYDVIEPLPICGAGISHLDLPFVRAFMPALAARTTYWGLDISPTRRMLTYVGRDDLVDLATDVDAKPHRALGDARLHLAEARRYFGLLAQLPRA